MYVFSYYATKGVKCVGVHIIEFWTCILYWEGHVCVFIELRTCILQYTSHWCIYNIQCRTYTLNPRYNADRCNVKSDTTRIASGPPFFCVSEDIT